MAEESDRHENPAEDVFSYFDVRIEDIVPFWLKVDKLSVFGVL